LRTGWTIPLAESCHRDMLRCGCSLTGNGLLGLRGWQWVFMVTGIPAVVIGFITLFYLEDRPQTAHFLHPEDKGLAAPDAGGRRPRLHKTSHENPPADH
jgi:hypothetical protein